MLDRIILAPYFLSLKLRHYLYDKGIIFKSHPCEVPTVCVGNITVGGTGKTPHTEMILRILLNSDEWAYRNVAVLSRGHKRKSAGFQQVNTDSSARMVGDEPLQIKKKFPQLTVAVDRTRVEGCDFLCHPDKLKTSKHGRKCADKEIPRSDIIVLDDAFQYRALRSWFNIVLVDYNRPVYRDRLLPFGRLRDLPSRTAVADVVIITKCPAYMEDWERVRVVHAMGIKDFDPRTCTGVSRTGKQQKVLFTSISYCDLKPVYEEGDQRYIYSKKLILFSGIAKDTQLRRYLSDKYKIIKRFKFDDHHKFSFLDIAKIRRASDNCPTAVIVTTEKDSQRILDNRKIPVSVKQRLFTVPIEVRFLSDHEKEIFETTLLDSLRSFHPDY